jgi:hypothetical protein
VQPPAVLLVTVPEVADVAEGGAAVLPHPAVHGELVGARVARRSGRSRLARARRRTPTARRRRLGRPAVPGSAGGIGCTVTATRMSRP